MTVDSTFRISDIPIAAFGSRAHLEEKALATVQYYDCPRCFICIFLFLCFSFTFHCLVEILHLISEEVVPQFFDEGFPSCCYLDCWSWNSWYTGKFLLRICFFRCGVTMLLLYLIWTSWCISVVSRCLLELQPGSFSQTSAWKGDYDLSYHPCTEILIHVRENR